MKKEVFIKHDLKKAPKTGEWRYSRPEVDKKKCIGCGTCVLLCPEAAIELKDRKEGKKTAKIDYDVCKGCGVCADVCLLKAIKILKEL